MEQEYSYDWSRNTNRKKGNKKMVQKLLEQPQTQTEPKAPLEMPEFPTKIALSDAILEGFKVASLNGDAFLINLYGSNMKKHYSGCAFGLAYIGLGGNYQGYKNNYTRDNIWKYADVYADVPPEIMEFISEKTGLPLDATAGDYNFASEDALCHISSECYAKIPMWNAIMHLASNLMHRDNRGHVSNTPEGNAKAVMILVQTLREHGL